MFRGVAKTVVWATNNQQSAKKVSARSYTMVDCISYDIWCQRVNVEAEGTRREFAPEHRGLPAQKSFLINILVLLLFHFDLY